MPSDSTLQAYFSFDNGATTDTSLYSHPTTYSNQVTVSGQRNQALYFTGNTTLNSYLQISNLASLGTSNTAYSISLWLQPAALYGDVAFVTGNANGMRERNDRLCMNLSFHLHRTWRLLFSSSWLCYCNANSRCSDMGWFNCSLCDRTYSSFEYLDARG